MFHFRGPTPTQNWPEAVAMLPANYSIKAVDNVQQLSEAKSVNPNIVTILRHYVANQVPGESYQKSRIAATNFFNTFIDGTFINGSTAGVPHRQTDYVEDFNEYAWFASQTPEEHMVWRGWALAALDVWYEQFWPELGVNLCLGNIPVGNDCDLAVAERVAFWTDLSQNRIPRIGYHSYWPVRNHTIAGGYDGDWKYYSGRWTEMDKRFLANGLRVHWAITEAGAIGYNGQWPNIGLNPDDGWLLPYVHDGRISEYLNTIKYFMNRWAMWNATNGHRCLSPNLFDTRPGESGSWKSFQLYQPNLNTIATFAAQNWLPQPPEEPEPNPPIVDRVVGVDVSRWQGNIRWAKTKEAGAEFTFVKATEGYSWEDPKFLQNIEGAKAAGLLTSAYHYFKADLNPLNQANWFLALVGEAEAEFGKLELPVAVDVEEIPNTPGFESRLLTFINRVIDVRGRNPILYTNPGFYRSHLSNTNWANYSDLWIAHWNVLEPGYPATYPDWTFHQYTNQGDGKEFGAESLAIDLNRFNGNLEALLDYAQIIPPGNTIKLLYGTNIRLTPQFSGEIGYANKLISLPAGTELPYLGTTLGEEYNGSDEWYVTEMAITWGNTGTVIKPMLHSKLAVLK